MRKLWNRFSHAAMVLFVSLFVFAGNAMAALPTELDLDEITTYGGIIIAALVALIVLRKAIKLTNRS